MKMFSGSSSLLFLLLVSVSGFIQANGTVQCIWCTNPRSRCRGQYIDCPYECPSTYSHDPKAKVCYADCDKPHCKSECKRSACYDPRFIGGDGVIFYFHGKSNDHFGLVSDTVLQINSRFTGHRPAGGTRDFTWIQSLGLLFNSQSFSLEATKAATWDSEVDHLKFTYNGQDLVIPEGSLSAWYSPEKDVKVERISNKNSAMITPLMLFRS